MQDWRPGCILRLPSLMVDVMTNHSRRSGPQKDNLLVVYVLQLENDILKDLDIIAFLCSLVHHHQPPFILGVYRDSVGMTSSQLIAQSSFT